MKRALAFTIVAFLARPLPGLAAPSDGEDRKLGVAASTILRDDYRGDRAALHLRCGS